MGQPPRSILCALFNTTAAISKTSPAVNFFGALLTTSIFHGPAIPPSFEMRAIVLPRNARHCLAYRSVPASIIPSFVFLWFGFFFLQQGLPFFVDMWSFAFPALPMSAAMCRNSSSDFGRAAKTQTCMIVWPSRRGCSRRSQHRRPPHTQTYPKVRPTAPHQRALNGGRVPTTGPLNRRTSRMENDLLLVVNYDCTRILACFAENPCFGRLGGYQATSGPR